MRLRRFAGVSIAALAMAGAAAASAEPLKLRITYAGSSPGQFGPLLEGAADKGIYRHYGKSYVIESVAMRGSGPALTAIGAGEVEIAALSYESFGNGVVQAKLDLRVIADVLGTGMHGWGDDPFMARKGEFRSFADIKGRVAGVPSRGSAPDTALRHYGAKHGLKHGEDYQVVEVSIPAMIAALEAKRVDLAFTSEPFTGIAERSGKYEKVFTVADSLGVNQSLVWVARADFIAKNRAALVDFMEDHIRLRHWCFDPAKRDEVVKFVAAVVKRPIAAVDYVFTKRDHWRDPNARPDLQLLQKNMDQAKDLGLLKETFQIVPRYADMSLIEDALKRIR